jgi:hypothetical protein
MIECMVIEEDLEVSGCGLIEVIFRNLLGETERNQRKRMSIQRVSRPGFEASRVLTQFQKVSAGSSCSVTSFLM